MIPVALAPDAVLKFLKTLKFDTTWYRELLELEGLYVLVALSRAPVPLPTQFRMARLAGRGHEPVVLSGVMLVFRDDGVGGVYGFTADPSSLCLNEIRESNMVDQFIAIHKKQFMFKLLDEEHVPGGKFFPLEVSGNLRVLLEQLYATFIEKLDLPGECTETIADVTHEIDDLEQHLR
jgi:hypothetical protein